MLCYLIYALGDRTQHEKQIRKSEPAITLDLEEVTLVDVEIVRFLGTCEARGATLLEQVANRAALPT